MKRLSWIIYPLLFAAICMAADTVIGHIILGDPYLDANRISHLYHEHGNEIPIFGSSQVRFNYIPSEISPQAFNYGFNAASLGVSDALLEIELAKAKTTPVIVDLQISGISSLGDIANYLPLSTHPEIRGLLQRDHALEWHYLVPGIRFFGYYDYYVRDYLGLSYHRATIKLDRGFVVGNSKDPFLNDPTPFQDKARLRAASSYGYFPDADENNRLIQLIANHTNRRFFLVYSPYHSSCFVKLVNGDKLKAFQDQLRAFPNVELIDWSRLNYPDAYFLDTIHLSEAGAEDFSRRLGQRIQQKLAAGSPAPGSSAPSAPADLKAW